MTNLHQLENSAVARQTLDDVDFPQSVYYQNAQKNYNFLCNPILHYNHVPILLALPFAIIQTNGRAVCPASHMQGTRFLNIKDNASPINRQYCCNVGLRILNAIYMN